jgi:hypothetical protein
MEKVFLYKNKNIISIFHFFIIYSNDEPLIKCIVYKLESINDVIIKLIEKTINNNDSDGSFIRGLKYNIITSRVFNFNESNNIIELLHYNLVKNNYVINYLLEYNGKTLSINFTKELFDCVYIFFENYIRDYEILIGKQKQKSDNSNINNIKYVDKYLPYITIKFINSKKGINKPNFKEGVIYVDPIIDINLFNYNKLLKKELLNFVYSITPINITILSRYFFTIMKKSNFDDNDCINLASIMFLIYVNYLYLNRPNIIKILNSNMKKTYIFIIENVLNSILKKFNVNPIKLNFLEKDNIESNLKEIVNKYEYIKYIDTENYIECILKEYNNKIDYIDKIKFNIPFFLTLNNDDIIIKTNWLKSENDFIKIYNDIILTKIIPNIQNEKNIILFDMFYIFKNIIIQFIPKISYTDLKLLTYKIIIPYLFLTKNITTFKLYY